MQTAQGANSRVRALRHVLLVAVFILPALSVLAVMVVYPIGYTVVRSTYDSTGSQFVGLDNYIEIVTEPRTLIALRNNMIWVLIVPAAVTGLGLILAVVAERMRRPAAFKAALFMPLVVSGLAAGVIFRILYEGDPDRGLANAALAGVVHLIRPPGEYAGARPSTAEFEPAGEAWIQADTVEPGEMVMAGLIALPPEKIPDSVQPAALPAANEDTVSGVVWLDFTRGGGGTQGVIDPEEVGLPGIPVELIDDGEVVAIGETQPDGSFVIDQPGAGPYALRLGESAFREPFPGVRWLGPQLILFSVISAYIWIQTGFAFILVSAGLSGLNREVQEAARVDGASEWQLFRFVTIPLLRPVLMVVFVTTTISVLKVFDLVLVIPPESAQNAASVLALEMWRASFGGGRDFGLGSALAVVLFLLIIPAMIFNLRRFKLDE